MLSFVVMLSFFSVPFHLALGKDSWPICFSSICLYIFCPFSLPLGVGGWLRLETVALPGLFY